MSVSQRRGVLFLLPVVVVVAVVAVAVSRAEFDDSLTYRADHTDHADRQKGSYQSPREPKTGDSTVTESFAFDPNTVTYRELVRLGMSKSHAAGFVKYRAAGKEFGVREEFAACYGVSEEMYDRLEKYIVIGEKWRTKPHYARDESEYGSPSGRTADGRVACQHDSLFRFDPNVLDVDGYMKLGFSQAQAENIINYRSIIGGYVSVEAFGKCYMVSPERLEKLRPYMDFAPQPGAAKGKLVDINSADSALLRSVNGIGGVLVVRIMERRRALGGFHCVEQLSEIQGMSEPLFEMICKQIYADSCIIQKFDVNFVAPKQLAQGLSAHPYGGDVVVRKMLKQRQLKGGWSSIRDMVEQNILTSTQADKLAPYLIFRPM